MSVSRSGETVVKDYLNYESIMWENAWWGDGDEIDGTHTDTVDDNAGRPRALITYVDIDVPEDHLIEIHGFLTAVGDPYGGDLTDEPNSKFDLFVYNNTETPPAGAAWDARMNSKDDELIFQTSYGVSDAEDLGGPQQQRNDNAIWFPSDRPILSTGKLVVDFGMGAYREDDEGGGEIALIMFYDFVEVGQNQVLEELLQVS